MGATSAGGRDEHDGGVVVPGRRRGAERHASAGCGDELLEAREVVDAGVADPGAGGSGAERRLYVDSDGDGDFDTVLVDSDGDGIADAAFGADAPEFGR